MEHITTGLSQELLQHLVEASKNPTVANHREFLRKALCNREKRNSLISFLKKEFDPDIATTMSDEQILNTIFSSQIPEALVYHTTLAKRLEYLLYFLMYQKK